MLSAFVLITGDNWDVNMKFMMLLNGPWLAALFTIVAMIIGVYTVLNLFLAILLNNLDQLNDVNQLDSMMSASPKRFVVFVARARVNAREELAIAD